MKYIIIINDFRGFPIMAALSIAKKHKYQDVCFLLSKKYLHNREYGQNLPFWYKMIKIKLINFFFDIIFVPELQIYDFNESMKVGVSSSLQSITCDSGADEYKYPRLANELNQQAIGSYEISVYINDLIEKPRCVYLFNGRTASASSISHSLHYSNITIKYYEFALKSNGYRVFPFPCHNSLRIGYELLNLWKWSIKSNLEIFKNGCEFERDKLSNNYTSYYSLLDTENFDITVFLGSDHEYTNLQLDIVEMKVIGNLKLIEYVVEKYGIQKKIAVRAHPNQKNDPNWNIVLKPITDFCSKYNIKFFDPESKVSSYKLIKNSSLVVVEYSSIAYDAIFLGAKVDIVGDLDIKSILSSLPSDNLKNLNELKEKTREILAFSKDLCHHYFPNKIYSFYARFFTYIERLFFKSGTKHFL